MKSGNSRVYSGQITKEISLIRSLRSNPRRFWTYIKSKTKVKSSIPNLKSPEGNEATTDSDKAAILNSFFSSVFTNEDLDSLLQIENH